MSDPEPPEQLPGARLLFSLDPAHSHLNHGSFGTTPISVQRAQQRLRDEMEADPQKFFTRGLHDRIEHSRRHLATFLGADPDRSALVTNTTSGVAVVLGSLGIGAGDEVITTDHGYGSVSLAIAARGARERVVPVELTLPDDEIASTIAGAVDRTRTRLVIVDLVSSPTARRMPVERIAAALRPAGVPLLVDGAHGPGLMPLTVDSLGADFFVGNLHKWAFAPRGTAILTVAEQWRSSMMPRVVSWAQPEGFPRSVEFFATADYTGWLAAPAGVFMLRTLGPERVWAHNAALVRYGQRVVGSALGLDPGQLPEPGADSPMRMLPLPQQSGESRTIEDAHALRDRIADRLRASVAINLWRGRLLLRLCAQIYNRAEEYDRLAEALPGLLAS
ncbi:aminotransferase class V-fold PLP-dependent enzyme [Rugosimonospora africana]|uniref:Isopenicillin-N epimerase n=1 Tax=Rugosimonospora africana TaxID=556532 RepID=A0A8J3QP53_9ACTN|nr:aminotransferase class V-fold PLP-dependent enzyme [Rugosimonospora africana]GIH13622.1 isopenicillin-N epimerase [Rugosimonospora africana]